MKKRIIELENKIEEMVKIISDIRNEGKKNVYTLTKDDFHVSVGDEVFVLIQHEDDSRWEVMHFTITHIHENDLYYANECIVPSTDVYRRFIHAARDVIIKNDNEISKEISKLNRNIKDVKRYNNRIEGLFKESDVSVMDYLPRLTKDEKGNVG